MAQHNIIIFTDLDGCLLDHNNYSFSIAKPLLQQLEKLGIPLILNSSKTQLEIEKTQRDMNLNCPFIIENGAAIYFTMEQTKQLVKLEGETLDYVDHYAIKRFAQYHEQILSVANRLRKKYQFQYKGFSDMTTDQIAGLTQLSKEDAFLASQRNFSEPLLWQDNQAHLLQFKQLLLKQNINMTEGGRFINLSGQYNKGLAMQWLVEHWPTNKCNNTNNKVIALGDSMNDVSMLNKSDYAIIIKNKAQKIKAKGKVQTTYSSLPGTAGWVETLSKLLTADFNITLN